MRKKDLHFNRTNVRRLLTTEKAKWKTLVWNKRKHVGYAMIFIGSVFLFLFRLFAANFSSTFFFCDWSQPLNCDTNWDCVRVHSTCVSASFKALNFLLLLFFHSLVFYWNRIKFVRKQIESRNNNRNKLFLFFFYRLIHIWIISISTQFFLFFHCFVSLVTIGVQREQKRERKFQSMRRKKMWNWFLLNRL